MMVLLPIMYNIHIVLWFIWVCDLLEHTTFMVSPQDQLARIQINI